MQRLIRRSKLEAKRNDPDGSPFPPSDSKRGRKEKGFGAATCFLSFVLILGVLSFIMLDSHPKSSNISPTTPLITTKNPPTSPIDARSESVIVECIVSTVNWKSDQAANGVLSVTIYKDAPEADLFLYLVSEGHYDGTHIFRVIKGFVAQFGFHPDTEMRNWDARIESKRKELVSKNADKGDLHNERGTLTMIKGSSPQMFLNLGDNRRLDKDGTLPVGFVSKESMKVAEKIYTGYKPGLGQIPSIKNGTVSELFPRMSKIEKCYLRET